MQTESQRWRKYECKQGEMERGLNTWSQWWGGMMAGMEGGRHEISSICLAWTFSMCCTSTTQWRN